MTQESIQLSEEEKTTLEQIEKNISWYEDSVKNQTPLRAMLESRSPKRDLVLDWAEFIKQKFTILKIDHSLISKEIKKTLRKNGLESLALWIHEILPSEFKEHQNGEVEPRPNTSGFRTSEDSLPLKSLAILKLYHHRFIDVIEKLETHLKDDKIHKDFDNSLEWQEIAKMCSTIETLAEPLGVLDQINDDLNLRQLVDNLRTAMCKFLQADESFRTWAHKFGVSPRQHQRIRERLDEWPEKKAATVIKKVLGSYLCPCGCNYNIVTGKLHVDITDDSFFLKYRFRDRDYKIPDEFKDKGLNPMQIAERVWMKKLVLVSVA